MFGLLLILVVGIDVAAKKAARGLRRTSTSKESVDDALDESPAVKMWDEDVGCLPHASA